MPIPKPLPDLPRHVEPDALRAMDDAALTELVSGLRDTERATIAAMAPSDRQMKEVRARIAEIATERRRRERAAKAASRRAVREQAAAGHLPSLADALGERRTPLPPDTPLSGLRLFLASGGAVSLGFPGRPGPTSFTDGRQSRTATTWGEARRLYADGWEPGTPQVSGVRVHLAGTKVERVVSSDDVVIDFDQQ